MKITGNEVEVAKHQSVIAPIVVVVVLFLFAAVGQRVVVPSSTPAKKEIPTRHQKIRAQN